MPTRHETGGFAATSAPDGFDLNDFEEAGLRVIERRFGPKDTIFTPGDPDNQLYFVLSEYASGPSGLAADGQLRI